MAVKIDKKIVGYRVITDEEKSSDTRSEAVQDAVPDIIHMHESIQRPSELSGTTYKIKPPEHIHKHAIYVTINDIVLNEGTEHEARRPFEIFINSKNMDNFQWIVALTRVLSAVFRKGGDITFLVEELQSIFDPNGGYWDKGKYRQSLVAEIGSIIEYHLRKLNIIEDVKDPNMEAFIESKKKELQGKDSGENDESGDGYPENATICKKCNNKAVVVMDGCATCLACGDSKCG